MKIKKLFATVAVGAMVLTGASQAMAAFDFNSLVLTVYKGAGAPEVGFDLGTSTALTSGTKYSGTSGINLSDFGSGTTFSQLTFGVYGIDMQGSNFDQLYAVTSQAGSAPAVTGGGWGNIGTPALTINPTYQALSSTGKSVISNSSETTGYYTQMIANGDGAGSFAGFIPAQTGESSLASLQGAAVGSYVEMALYQFTNVGTGAIDIGPGTGTLVGTVRVTLNSTGGADISVSAVSSVPIPPSVLLLGSGLLGLVGIRRKNA